MADLLEITLGIDTSPLTKLEVALERANKSYDKLNNALAKGKIGLVEYRAETDKLDQKIIGLQNVINGGASAVEEFTRKMNAAAVSKGRFGYIAQQVGYQVGDFFVQVQSGTKVLVAFGQQATQLAGLLPGVWGALFQIGISLGTAIANSLSKTKVSMKDITDYFGSMGPVVAAIGDAFVKVGKIIVEVANLILNNMGRVLDYAIATAIYFYGPFVASFVGAALSVASLTTAFEFLKVALIRTGIGAVIVLAGEMIYQFTKLVEGAGGFGVALALLSNVANEAMQRVRIVFGMVPPAVQIVTKAIQVYFANMWNGILQDAAMPLQWLQDKLLTLDDFLNGPNKGRGTATPVTFTPIDTSQLEGGIKYYKGQLDGLKEQFSAPMQSIDDLMEALKKADKEGKQIDIADWFSGGGKKKKTGGPSEDTIKNKLKDLYTYLDAVDKTNQYLVEEESIAYQQREDLLKTALKRNMINLEEYHKYEKDLTMRHQQELMKIERMRQDTQIKDAGTFFGGLADLAKVGGDKASKAVKVFSAAQALTNSYLAFTQVLADPSLIGRPWARFGMAASALASGLSAVAAINSGGGSVKTSGSTASTPAPTSTATQQATPQTVMIQGVKPTDIFTGEQLSALFDSLYKENRNRGMVFQVAR